MGTVILIVDGDMGNHIDNHIDNHIGHRVDNDNALRPTLADHLTRAGFAPIHANSGAQALELARTAAPALALLDLDLPDMDRFDVLRALRQQPDSVPVILLTAHPRALDEIVGLNLGADDYVTKPYDVDVLLAHIRAVLRRVAHGVGTKQASPPPSFLEVGDLRIDLDAHIVHVNGKVLELRHRVYDLLVALAQNAGRVLTEEALLSRVWGAEWVGETQTLYVHIHDLRTKIEDDPVHPKRLLTVRGAGYKLVP